VLHKKARLLKGADAYWQGGLVLNFKLIFQICSFKNAVIEANKVAFTLLYLASYYSYNYNYTAGCKQSLHNLQLICMDGISVTDRLYQISFLIEHFRFE